MSPKQLSKLPLSSTSSLNVHDTKLISTHIDGRVLVDSVEVYRAECSVTSSLVINSTFYACLESGDLIKASLPLFDNVETIKISNGSLNALVSTSSLLVCAGQDTLLYFFNPSTNTAVSVHGHAQDVTSLTSLGSRIMSGSFDTKCKVWDIESMGQVHEFQADDKVYCVAASDSKYFAATRTGKIHVWDDESLDCEILDGHDGFSVARLLLHGNLLYSAGDDGMLCVWKGSELLYRVPAHDDLVSVLVINQTTLYSACFEQLIIWNIGLFMSNSENIDMAPKAEDDIASLRSQLEKAKSLIESQSRQKHELMSELTQTRTQLANLKANCINQDVDSYKKKLDLTTSAHCVALKSLVKTLDSQYLTIEKDLSSIQRWLNQTHVHKVSDGLLEFMDLNIRSGVDIWERDSDWDSDVNDCIPEWFLTGEHHIAEQEEVVELADDQDPQKDDVVIQMVELSTEIVDEHPLLSLPTANPPESPKKPSLETPKKQILDEKQEIFTHSPPKKGILDIPQPKVNELFAPIDNSLNSVLQTPINDLQTMKSTNSIPTPPTSPAGWFTPLKAFVDSVGDALNIKQEAQPHLRVANPDQPWNQNASLDDIPPDLEDVVYKGKVGVWKLGLEDESWIHKGIQRSRSKRKGKRESVTQEIAKFAQGFEEALEEVLEAPFKWFE